MQLNLEATPNAVPGKGHFIICGLGHLGYRVLCLLQKLGIRGVVISKEIKDEWRAQISSAFTVIDGDARDMRNLEAAGISSAGAVMALTDDDLCNVSIALDARRLNSEAAIVIRLFDQELGASLEKSINISRAFSSTAIAAPAFVAAVLGERLKGSFLLGNEIFSIEDNYLPDKEPISSAVAPLVLQRGHEYFFGPQAQQEQCHGELLTVLRIGTELKRFRRKKSASIFTAFREWLIELPFTLRITMILVPFVIAFSVAIFHYALNLSVIDAFYFVVTTLTTVGYGDINLLNASTGMKIYGSFLMLYGAGIMATIFSISTGLLLNIRFRELFAKGCSRTTGHIIVTGFGSIGYRLIKELVRRGENVVAIEQLGNSNPGHASENEVPVVRGNAGAVETLHKAGLSGAKALIAATNDDLINLSTALAAKRTNSACRVVLRMFDSELAGKMKKNIGVDTVLSVSEAAAPCFVAASMVPGALYGILLHDGLLLISSRKIDTTEQAKQVVADETKHFFKHAGAPCFELVTGGTLFLPGDELIVSRWFHFCGDGVTKC